MLMMSVISEKITSKLNEGMIKDWLDSVLPGVLSFFWSVVLALLVFFIGRKIILWFIKLIEKAMRRHKLEEGVVQFTRSLLTIAMYIGLGLPISNLTHESVISMTATGFSIISNPNIFYIFNKVYAKTICQLKEKAK